MPPASLDRIDLAILALLQREGRLSNAELAQRVNLSPSATLRRVQRLEAEGVISGYGARQYDAAGRPITNFLTATSAFAARQAQLGVRADF